MLAMVTARLWQNYIFTLATYEAVVVFSGFGYWDKRLFQDNYVERDSSVGIGTRYVLDGPGFDPRTVQPIASPYTNWAIPAWNNRLSQ
jgi:hypothetical protein